MKKHHVKGIRVDGFTDFPKLYFSGLLIYLLTYRFTVSEDQRNAEKRIFGARTGV
jgi:hypothetical protein